MGGLWEAGVKSFKAHLKKITHAQFFTFEEFTTMLELKHVSTPDPLAR